MIETSSSPKGDHGLPEHIRHDPAMLDWRLSKVEGRLSKLEERPSLSLPEGFPWLRLAGLLLLLGLGIKGHISPDQALGLAGKLLGIDVRP